MIRTSKLGAAPEADVALERARLEAWERDLQQREAKLARSESQVEAEHGATPPLFASSFEELRFAKETPEWSALRRDADVALEAAESVVASVVEGAEAAVDQLRSSAAAHGEMGDRLLLLERHTREPSSGAALRQLCSLSALLARAGRLFRDVATFREIEATALESAFVAPLRDFQRVALGRAQQYRAREREAAAAIESALCEAEEERRGEAALAMGGDGAGVALSVESAVSGAFEGLWAALGGGSAGAGDGSGASSSSLRRDAADARAQRERARAAASVRVVRLRAHHEACRYAACKGAESALNHLRVAAAESVVHAVLVVHQGADQARTAARPLSAACTGLLPAISAARTRAARATTEGQMRTRAVATLARSDEIGAALASSDVVCEARAMDERGECSVIYRYMLRESCSQFDSLPLTSLTRSRRRLRSASDGRAR